MVGCWSHIQRFGQAAAAAPGLWEGSEESAADAAAVAKDHPESISPVPLPPSTSAAAV